MSDSQPMLILSVGVALSSRSHLSSLSCASRCTEYFETMTSVKGPLVSAVKWPRLEARRRNGTRLPKRGYHILRNWHSPAVSDFRVHHSDSRRFIDKIIYLIPRSKTMRPAVLFRPLRAYTQQIRHATSLRMPAMSPTMTEGGIAGWKKAEGESFAAGDVLLEVVCRALHY